MKVDDKLLDYLIKLSYLPLKLTQEERDKLKKDLSSILDYINQLQELDTSKVEILQRPYPLKNIGHEDEVRGFSLNKNQLFPAKTTHQGYLVVKRIIQKEVDR